MGIMVAASIIIGKDIIIGDKKSNAISFINTGIFDFGN